MAINVTLGEVKTQEEKPFPKLMRAKSVPEFIVLFFDSNIGTCVTSSGDYIVGHPYKSGSSFFEDFNEPITLQNA